MGGIKEKQINIEAVLLKENLVEAFYECGIFSFSDLFFAKTILKDFTKNNREQGFFLAYLFFLSRKGHSCFFCSKEKIFPSLHLLFQEYDLLLSKEIIEEVEKMVLLGKEKFQQKFQCNNEHMHVVVFWNDYIYLQKNWLLETQIIDCLNEMIKFAVNKDHFDEKKFLSSLNEAEKKQELLSEQKEIIVSAFNNKISLICGGPGTGKTYTAAHLVKLFCLSLLPHEYKIIVTAPTGKAAIHLYKSIKKIVDNNERIHMEAKTLHSLLKIGSDSYHSAVSLDYDLILVDEASMIDLQMMAKLFQATPKKARIILMGDPDQLPPIDTGNVFYDLSRLAFLKRNNCINALQKSMRFSNEHMQEIALAVKQGKNEEILSLLQKPNTRVDYIHLDNEKAFLEKLINEAKNNFPLPSKAEMDPKVEMEKLEQFRVLSTLKKGKLGYQYINKNIFEKLHENIEENDWFTVPIIILKNDFSMQLFNGMTGIIVGQKRRKKPFFSNIDKSYFFIDGEIKQIPVMLLPFYELAYCISVHKSQGSEYQKVLFIMPKGSQLLGKKALYTGITRAKNELIICSEDQIIRETISSITKRVSGIASRIS